MDKIQDDIHIKKWCITVTINDCKNLFLSSWKRKIVPLTDKEESITSWNQSSLVYGGSILLSLPGQTYAIYVWKYNEKIEGPVSLSIAEITLKARGVDLS